MHSLIQKLTTQRIRQEIAILTGIGMVACLLIYYGGDLAILMLYALCLTAGVIGMAYYYPVLTVTLWILSTLFAQQLLASSTVLVGAGIDLRYSDPVLVGVAGALLLKLVLGEERAQHVFTRQSLFWTLFVVWLFIQLTRSMGTHGVVAALGEFRTYFQHLLILPYVVIFIRTRQRQWQLFWMLLGLSLIALMVIAFANMAVLNAFKVKFGAQGNLAVVYGVVALYLMHQYGYWKYGKLSYAFLLLSAIPLTVLAGHRSVWLAAAVAIGTLMLLGYIPWIKSILLVVLTFLCLLLIDFFRSDIDFFAFLEKRLLAFTSFEEDGTARWRYHIWQDALRQSESFLWSGKGLGNYFMTRDNHGNLVTSSLHNQYVQLVFQTGLVGLCLYLAFVVQTLRGLWRSYTGAGTGQDRLISLIAFTVLVTASAFYVPYGFDYFTWLYVGLGLAVAQSQKERDGTVEHVEVPLKL